jgi:methylated-DNA-[protein]-cysteine S-methyltransferase|tara:strand:- start:71 stop:370 length:300 start_codon:yes stop_codon:yes gene_type:complete
MKLNRPSNNDFRGTKFQKKVWNYLKTIRKGTVKTYKQVAIAINRPKSARAVANAVGKNPFAPKIPCHRVIRSDGSLGGYSGKGGVKTKKLLLKREGVIV